MLKRWLISLLVPVLLLPVTAAGQESDPARSPSESYAVSHEVSFGNKNHQYLRVSASFAASEDPLDLFLPSWAPGSYLIRDFATNLEGLVARGSDGRELNVTKIAKNHWQITVGDTRRVTVEYDVWAGRRNVSESWVESEFALLNGAGIFLYNEQSRGAPQSVRVVLPPDWRSIHTSLVGTGTENEFRAEDYDELVDSPILVGNPRAYDFEVDGHPYSLVMLRDNPLSNDEQAAKDVADIVQTHKDFWGANPFDRRYLFLNLYMDKFGGLEHDHSTVLMTNNWQLRGRRDYIQWLGLVSHEFFHAWNIRRMRPEALTEYDYSREVYTRELWLVEGLTSYYDNLLLFRAGLIDVADYFKLLAEEIRRYETTPGREVRSAELASFDTWIKHYKPDSNRVNSTISYYGKGALIGFVTDMEIRRATNNRASLDTVITRMFARYGRTESRSGGYPPGAFEDIVEDVAGAEVRNTVDRMIKTTADPDIDGALAWYGLRLVRGPATETASGEVGGIGVNWRIDGASVFADYVVRDYPASNAGVIPGDELLAINGFRVDADSYLGRLLKLEVAEAIDLTLVRDGRLLTLTMVTDAEIPPFYSIVTDSRLSNREKGRMSAWLGRELQFRN